MVSKAFFISEQEVSDEIELGGAKKKSIAQMEKSQVHQEEKPEAKKTKTKPSAEQKGRGIELPNINDSRFLGELSKMSVVTPFSLAYHFNLRLSVAKDVIEELERKRLVRPVAGNARIRIYQPSSG